jgi:hypothetical protein
MVAYWFAFNVKDSLFSTQRGRVGKSPVEVAVLGGPDLKVVGRGHTSEVDEATFIHLMSITPFPLGQTVLFYREEEGDWHKFGVTPEPRREVLCASAN